jgi:anaerobic magnesium-protoporphyrin IX monomethyl ester cyclase
VGTTGFSDSLFANEFSNHKQRGLVFTGPEVGSYFIGLWTTALQIVANMEISKNRVLLLYPASEAEGSSMIPLSLLYVAQPLLENSINVEIIDQRYEKNFFEALEKRIAPDVICVGISCITGPGIEQVIKINEFVKGRTNAPIVLGGSHPTLLPEQTLQSRLVDYVVIGKGEAPFLSLVNALKMNGSARGIPQVGYKKNGDVVINEGSMPEIETRKIPYHLVTKYGRHSVIPVLTSYGCPYNCAFCVEKVLHPKYYTIPVENVLFMIEEALKFRPKLINFIDDNFFLSKQRINDIFKLRQQRDGDFYWFCTGRVDEVLRSDDEFLRLMRKRGLIGVYFGIESGSPRILRLINKHITPEMALELNVRLGRAGITPHYSFMAGFPTETREDIEKTLKLIGILKEQNPRAVIWKINKYTPYPKTELFNLALQCGFDPPKTFEEWGRVHFYSEEYSAAYDVYL